MINKDEVIYGLEFTKAMITFNPLTGEDIEPENLNEDNKITYDACVGAIALLKEQEEQIKNRDESLEKAREEIKWLRGMLKKQEERIKKFELERSWDENPDTMEKW